MSTELILDQTRQIRGAIRQLVEANHAKADLIPPGWNNNLRWHIGHLVVTPRMLTFGLMKEDLGVPAEYRTWFAKGTSPREWDSKQDVPPLGQLLEEMLSTVDEIERSMKGRDEELFPQAYTTTPGIVLKSPADSIPFSLMHDGIHLGLILALRRALGG